MKMDYKKKQASGKDKLNDIVAADEESEEFEELSPQNTFGVRVTRQMEKFAGTRLGHLIFEKADRVLKVLEETAKWSLPQEESEIQLQRPLPWIFFLSLIVWLRAFRLFYSIVANILGAQPATPKSLVYYIQTKRRRLRAIRVQGRRTIRSRASSATGTSHNAHEKISFLSKIGKLLNSAICKPGQQRETPATEHIFKQAKEAAAHTAQRPHHEDINELTVSEMLDKFANVDSDEDSDYVPPENGADDDDDDDDVGDDSGASQNTTASADEIEQKLTNDKNDGRKGEKPNPEQVKENGATKRHSKSKPVAKPQPENHDEQMYTPELKESLENGNTREISLATTEVAPQQSDNTPKSSHDIWLTPQSGDSDKTSTPGHKTESSFEPLSNNVVQTGQTSSTPIESVSDDGGASSVPPDNPHPRKTFYHSSHNKHHTHHYYNAKNRNKNRH